ncbi:MAG: GIY-YIG nuclease family protein [Terriglobales bacterium]
MATLYVLQSSATRRFYIGATSGMRRRLAEHERSHSPYTASRGPWLLVYKEEFPTLAEARGRERQLKRWKSHRLIEQLIAAAPG